MSKWNPEQYLQFRNERTQPTIDLVGRIELDQPSSGIDAGCGPGNSTQILVGRWPSAEITGLDNSPEMLARARTEYPQLNWILADLRSYVPERTWDVVLTSATLQWIKEHDLIVPRLFGMVNPGGALAVQVPANHESPLHHSFVRVASREPWRSHTDGCTNLLTYRPASYYYDLLAAAASHLDVWETTYYHVLDSHRGLIDWYRSTAMRPVLNRLGNDHERRQFEQEVLEGCQAQYELRADGRLLYPFKRLFFVAYSP